MLASTFEFECEEKGGAVRRQVRLMSRSVPEILDTIEKMKRVPNFLPPGDEVRPFIRADYVMLKVDDVGVIALCPEGELVHVHVTFWDRKLRGREALCRTVAEWTHAFWQKTLITGIPESSKVVIEFVKRVGFKEQGVKNGVVILTFPNYPE